MSGGRATPHYCACTPRSKSPSGRLRVGKKAPHLIRDRLGTCYPGCDNIKLRDDLEEYWLCDDCYALEMEQAGLGIGPTGDENRHATWQR